MQYFGLIVRFEDVKRSISNTKEFIVEEGDRINGTLLAFENKFEKILEQVKNESSDNLTQLKNSFQKTMENMTRKNEKLEHQIEEEKRERLEQSKLTHEQIINRLENLETSQTELQNGLASETKLIRQEMENDKFVLGETINQEKKERLEKEKVLKNELMGEVEFQKKFVEDMHQKLGIEFNHVTTNLQKEVQHRLKEQDDMLENLSKVVVTLQKTLEILGSN